MKKDMLHYINPGMDLKITEVYVNSFFNIFSRNALEKRSQRSLQHFFKNFFFNNQGDASINNSEDTLPRIIEYKGKENLMINEMLLLALLTV